MLWEQSPPLTAVLNPSPRPPLGMQGGCQEEGGAPERTASEVGDETGHPSGPPSRRTGEQSLWPFLSPSPSLGKKGWLTCSPCSSSHLNGEAGACFWCRALRMGIGGSPGLWTQVSRKRWVPASNPTFPVLCGPHRVPEMTPDVTVSIWRGQRGHWGRNCGYPAGRCTKQ